MLLQNVLPLNRVFLICVDSVANKKSEAAGKFSQRAAFMCWYVYTYTGTLILSSQSVLNIAFIDPKRYT